MTHETVKMFEFKFNESELCGNESFSIWSPWHNDLSICFEILVLVVPTHALLTLAAAFQLGVSSRTLLVIRSRWQKILIRIRATISLTFALITLAVFLALVYISTGHSVMEERGYSSIIEVFVVTLSWVVMFVYNGSLIDRGNPSYRGSKSVLLAYFLCLLIDILKARSEIVENNPEQSVKSAIVFAYSIAIIVLHGSYLVTFTIPSDDRDDDDYQMFQNPMESSTYLGIAQEFTPPLSRLILHWVNPLIKRGRRGLLNSPDDVFDLPQRLDTATLSQQFQMTKSSVEGPQSTQTKTPLLKILSRLHGKEFFRIGILKFLADCAGFASPLFLNLLISFMESKEEKMYMGYIYALGLAIASLIIAFCNTHFNLMMNELGLKIRACIVSAIYFHTVSISSADISKFSAGEVINFMSTDTDRIVNFCPSVHAAWSLPFQFAVTLGLLYQQVGVSSLAGVILTVLMIPLNKVIADTIGRRSTKMMLAKDERVKVMSEILHGIRVIKYFNWEDCFGAKVWKHRNEELKQLKCRKYLDAICVYLWATTPVLISVLTFTVYVLLGNELTASKVFTAVALFSMLTGPLNAFPWVLNGVVEAMVSIKRISNYLSLKTFSRDDFFDTSEVGHESVEDISIDEAEFSMKQEDEGHNEGNIFKLKNINLHVEKGRFFGVIGKVGSGKSVLLQSVLGESKMLKGRVRVASDASGIAYVQQNPWLQQGTIRDNILFGQRMDEDWYKRVVYACALKPDIVQLANGDKTNVGENGVMLSGGQKARVALARAVYQNKNIYLIDDIFSAVDSQVGSHIYKHCILGVLRDKTRVLCTHHPRFLAAADEAFVLEDGEIVKRGTPQTILSDADFVKEVEEDAKNMKNKEEEQKDGEDLETLSTTGDEEERERGRVKWRIYKNYWFAVGKILSPAILFSLLLMQGSRNFTDVWLAHWISAIDHSKNETSAVVDLMSMSGTRVTFYLIVYGSLAIANSIFSFTRAFLFAYGGICAANAVHAKLFSSIIHAKAYFFDSKPIGRILNRFSSDLYTVDDSLPFILNIFLANLFGIIGPIIVCAYSVPWIALVLLPMTFIYLDLQKKYRPASRDLKRISSVTLSPIYAHFSETLGGLQTIRAMQAVERFKLENEEKLECNQRAQYASVAAAQWLEMRLQLIGCGVVTGIAVIAMIEHHYAAIDPGFVGLAISYALGITGKLSGLVSSFTETEKQLVAVERCYHYINNTPTDEEKKLTNDDEFADWPREGKITFDDVTMRYRDFLPWALQNVSFEVQDSEKFGIIGRTGSGKSSIFQSLFRMYEISHGRIMIDGKSLARVPKRILRRRLAIIPQDPFLFAGTIRENLDPRNETSDERVWKAIQDCSLSSVIERIGGLHAKISEKGNSFSIGQKQLFCLARAILSDAKIICIDEATANVDLETDRLIQQVLRTSLQDKTVLTIAHRLETVMNYDRIMVMSNGGVAEIEIPHKLTQVSSQ